jgi:hypothetical protein
VAPFIATSLLPFALGFAFGGYAFDRATRGPLAPAHSVGTSGHSNGVGVGP